MTIEVDGAVYSLQHLEPFTHVCPSKGKDNTDLVVHVSFMTHVYSKSLEIVSHPHHLFDENGVKRAFCLDRYTLSLTLQELCIKMMDENYLTWISQDKNGISNMSALDGPISDGNHYVIFYYVFPSRRTGCDVELVVKSAYRKDIIAHRIKRRYNVIQKLRECLFSEKKIP